MKKQINGYAAMVLAAAVLISFSGISVAALKDQPRALGKLLDCRSVTDAAARLACYDLEVSAIERATANDEVVVLDREDVRKTRRSLFGFSFPKLPFLGDGKDDGDDKTKAMRVDQIEDKIESVRSLGYGEWAFDLADGSKWQTIAPMPFGTPKNGMTILIKRAALGSYKANVNGWTAVKVKRVG